MYQHRECRSVAWEIAPGVRNLLTTYTIGPRIEIVIDVYAWSHHRAGGPESDQLSDHLQREAIGGIMGPGPTVLRNVTCDCPGSEERGMQKEIRTIRLPLPFGLGRVNCYLVETEFGYVLVDTGGANRRGDVEKELARAGCEPGNLNLILLTHGDFDHIGNAAFLRRKFGARIAMHKDDSEMAERGDMFWNRKSGGALIRVMVPVLFRFGRSKRFRPDLCIGDGHALADHGFDATVVTIPGHSTGSIGILTAGGELICGDLFENSKQPVLNSIMDDPAAASASVEKLKSLAITTVYPGHGEPFSMERFLNSNR